MPFNLLLNGRFDNGVNHWARQGVSVVENGQGTSDYSALFAGAGERWIEQTVSPDNRDAYTLSFDITSSGPQGWVPTYARSPSWNTTTGARKRSNWS